MIGRTNAGGGGLNFKVVGGSTQPGNPKENTIWIDTDAEITGWSFSATEPESPDDGMVWVEIGSASAVQFNALKKNCVLLYPITAKQYVSGAFVDKAAMIYADGTWSLFIPPKEYLIQDGVIDMTDHPYTVTENSSTGTKATNSVTYNERPALQMKGRNGAYCTYSFSNVAVPAWATVFYVEIYRIPTYNGDPSINIGGASVKISRGSSNYLTNITASIDVSSVSGNTGNLRFRFQAAANNYDCYIGNAWFE